MQINNNSQRKLSSLSSLPPIKGAKHSFIQPPSSDTNSTNTSDGSFQKITSGGKARQIVRRSHLDSFSGSLLVEKDQPNTTTKVPYRSGSQAQIPEDYQNMVSQIIENHQQRSGYLRTLHEEPINQNQQLRMKRGGSKLKQSIHVSFNSFKKSVQISESEDQIIPIMLSLKIDDKDCLNGSRQPLDLICVIDKSGSMHGQKIELAKKTLKTILGFLNQNDRLQIIQFDEQAKLVTGLLTGSVDNKNLFSNAIDTITAEGNTNITEAMSLALRQLQKRKQKNSVTSIFLLSDGNDDNAYLGVRQAIKEYPVNDTFTINTFGFGNDHDSQLLSGISSLKDGNFYFIHKLNTLDECFADAFGGLASVACHNISINVFPTHRQLKIVRSYGVKKTESYQKNLQYMMHGTSKDYIFEVLVPKGLELKDHHRSQQVALAKIQLFETGTGIIVHLNQALSLDVYSGDEDMPQEPVDLEVEYNYFRVKSAQYINEAKIYCTQKQYSKAQDRLKSLIRRLKRLDQTERTQLLIQDIEAQLKVCKQYTFEEYGMSSMTQAQYQQQNQLSQPHLSSQKTKSSSQNSAQYHYQRLVQSEKNN